MLRRMRPWLWCLIIVSILSSYSYLSGLTLFAFDTTTGGRLTSGVESGTSYPTVVVYSATNISSSSATLNGELLSLGQASTVQVCFEYGLTPGFGSVTSNQTMSAPGAFTAILTGLTPNTIYDFRAIADGGIFGASNGDFSLNFTTLNIFPTVTTNPATDVETYSAVLNGTVTSMGGYSNVTVYFEFGPTQGYGTITGYSQSATTTGSFNYTLTGLSPNTLYHYRAVVDLLHDGIVNGDDLTFTTAPALPAVSTDSISNLSANSATLIGQLNSMGSALSVNVFFEYGTTTQYGNVTPGQTRNSPGIFSSNISGLAPNSIYHFRAKVSGGSGVASGNDLVITTNATAPSGKIAFTSEREGLYESKVYMMGADGSGQTKLTGPIVINNISARDGAPSCSPDGTRIVFDSSRSGNRDIYIVDTSGNLTQLTAGVYDNGWPVWSPKSNRIAFVSNRDSTWQIYVMDIDGSAQTRLTNDTANDLNPHWLPDGSLAFTSDRDGTTKTYVMNSDGSSQRLLIGPDGAWSPDHTRVVFSSASNGNWDIYVVNADGTNQTKLTNNIGNNITPVWSPDGKNIAFASDRDGYYEIYVMNPDGSNQTRITSDPSKNYFPCWTVGNWVSQNVSTLNATYLTPDSVQLKGELTSLGSLSSVSVSFVILTSPGNYTLETTSQTMTGTGIFTVNLTNLNLGSAISYRAKVTGNGISYGEPKSFTFVPPNNSIALTSSLNPSSHDQSVIFTATVSAIPPASGVPGGTVTFEDGAQVLGTGILNNSGQATYRTSTLTAGSHSIFITYDGDSSFTSSASPVLYQNIWKRGDANGDGVVNMGDVTYLERVILGLVPPTCGSDAYGNGVINMADVTEIERIILALDPQ